MPWNAISLPSWASFSTPSPRTLLYTSVAVAALTASSLSTWHYLHKRKKIRRIKEEIGASLAMLEDRSVGSSTSGWKAGGMGSNGDEGLIREQLARNYAFLGDEAMGKVRKSFVIVVGLGGVGSHAAHMLLRSGVEHLRLIDFDQVSLSSLNRHAVATQADVGTSKAACLRKHFAEIAPHAKLEAVVELFDVANSDRLLAGKPDFVLDCIDNLNTKVHLIKYCHDHGLRIISSMGAGAKADPSRIQIADISDTFEDPLARSTRRQLRAQGVESGVTVVYSTEKPGPVTLLPLEEQKVENADEYSALPNFRVRILPVLGTIPALFGQSMASYVVTELAGFKTEPLAIKLRHKTYARLHTDLVNKEKDLFKGNPNIPLNISDIGYIFEEIWRGRSAISGTFEKLQLTRWDVREPAGFSNIVCLTRAEAEKHEKIPPGGLEAHYSKEVIDYVNERLAIEKEMSKWR
ncbi:hypothetical protein HK104_009101 [Borealophlyctis nickersoniae]|nr:hypothetical protein HK104_009101 [Borealophlyctis nickersoniae]